MPSLKVTNIERTLIDITVRPIYAGGTEDVLHAFKVAAGKFPIDSLVTMLKHIAHIYPYHQAIGFYMERSKRYAQEDLKLLRSFSMTHDFYLDYALKEPNYSPDWRVCYPKAWA